MSNIKQVKAEEFPQLNEADYDSTFILHDTDLPCEFDEDQKFKMMWQSNKYSYPQILNVSFFDLIELYSKSRLHDNSSQLGYSNMNTAEYLDLKFSEDKQENNMADGIKANVGGVVGGWSETCRRMSADMKGRTVIILDADYAKPKTYDVKLDGFEPMLDEETPVPGQAVDVWHDIEEMCWKLRDLGFSAILYTTTSWREDNPRFRVTILLDRVATPDEFQPINRKLMELLDETLEIWDISTSTDLARLNFVPVIFKDSEYREYIVNTGKFASVDDILAMYDDWTDPKQWAKRADEAVPRTYREQMEHAEREVGDYTDKPLHIRAFMEAYSIREAIDTFLTDEYEPFSDDRYTYVAGTSRGGLKILDDDTAYARQDSDPATTGYSVNGYDLVRIHLFGGQHDTDFDYRESCNEMDKLVEKDELSGPIYKQYWNEHVKEALEQRRLAKRSLKQIFEDEKAKKIGEDGEL